MIQTNNDAYQPRTRGAHIALPILEGERPLYAIARTALVPVDDALKRALPTEYRERPLKETMDYLMGLRDLRAKESTVLKGMQEQMSARNYIVQVNGHNADLSESTSRYVAEHTITTANGQTRTCDVLEIVVESVESGGRLR